MCGASAFTSAPKPDFRPNMTGAPSEQIAQTISDKKLLLLDADKIKNIPLSRFLSHSARIQQAGLDWLRRWSRQVGG